jgi:gamma-glutamylcyclotransferase (GGCT)/AIG2-like uncharacterized protein YtfP
MSADAFHLFVYGTLRSDGPQAELLSSCERVAPATVNGVLYDIDGDYPALLLYGNAVVHGEVWRCPSELLWRLDEYEHVEQGLFRRVGIEVDGCACWTYVAGPTLAKRLNTARRLESGDWLRRGRP